MSHPNPRRIRALRTLGKSVGLLTRFVATARPGKNAWCCESCRKAALRHGQDAPDLGVGSLANPNPRPKQEQLGSPTRLRHVHP